jgi:hypothetical protein
MLPIRMGVPFAAPLAPVDPVDPALVAPVDPALVAPVDAAVVLLVDLLDEELQALQIPRATTARTPPNHR